MRAFAIAALLLGAFQSAAFAQPARFEITPFAAYHWGGTITTEVSDLFVADVDVEDSEAFGLIVDVPLSYGLQLELLASRQDSQLELDSGLFDGDLTLADVTLDYYHVGLLWQWGAGQATPFVVVSGGVTRLAPDVPGADSETRGSMSIGGGVKIFVNRHLGFRFEGRGFVTELSDEDDDRYCNRCYDDEDNNFTQGEARAGLILRF